MQTMQVTCRGVRALPTIGRMRPILTKGRLRLHIPAGRPAVAVTPNTRQTTLQTTPSYLKLTADATLC